MQDHFLQLKSNLEPTQSFTDRVESLHNTVRTYLENNLPGFKNSKLIGSLKRKTRIRPGSEGEFDIDILVVMGEFHGWSLDGIAPQTAMSALHTTMEESARYSEMTPVQDAPTVTLTASDDIKIELVPAYVDMVGRDYRGTELGHVGRGYWVTRNGGSWEMADYDHEADYISLRNQETGGYLIPTIKMLKAIKRRHFPVLKSFPLEIIAAQIISNSILARQGASMPIYYHELLWEFFTMAPNSLSGAIHVPGSKSSAIALDTITVASLMGTFREIAGFIEHINGMTSMAEKAEGWRVLFGQHFPVTVAA